MALFVGLNLQSALDIGAIQLDDGAGQWLAVKTENDALDRRSLSE
jgi:hypothetical protein